MVFLNAGQSYRFTPPEAVDVAGKKMVQEIIAPRDRGEHAADARLVKFMRCNALFVIAGNNW